MTEKNLVEIFMKQKTLAVVGVSREKSKFGNVVYRELKNKGYNVFPVNQHLAEFEGDVCYHNLQSIPERPDGVVVVVSDKNSGDVVQDAFAAGITKIWLQQGSETDQAIKFCQENGIDVISGECFLMFLEPVHGLHRFHRWIWGLLGKLPG